MRVGQIDIERDSEGQREESERRVRMIEIDRGEIGRLKDRVRERQIGIERDKVRVRDRGDRMRQERERVGERGDRQIQVRDRVIKIEVDRERQRGDRIRQRQEIE